MSSTGSSQYNETYELKRRKPLATQDTDSELDDIINKTSTLKLNDKTDLSQLFINYINPLILTAISAFVRLWRIDLSQSVVWDEAHFGKFGSYYLKHEFYFDVHPPLGKLLVGLSGWLAGYNGHFKFSSSLSYPDDCNYVLMRAFNCMFGILCTPIAYRTAVKLGYSQFTIWFISLQVVFEMLSLTLSKFILLDSMLLFFTVLCFYCLVSIHNLRLQDKILSGEGIRWMIATGFSIGCVCSVKWVGILVTAVIGLYTVYDLLIKTYQLRSKKYPIKFSSYLNHWLIRIVTLIVIPFIIYVASFKVHFSVLTNSGPGDGSISSLLQASLNGTKIKYGPRSVGYGSLVTLRSQGLSPNLLHSHAHTYPEGSQQTQVTTYGYKDSNNEFSFEFDFETGLRNHFATLQADNKTTVEYDRLVKHGDTVRLVHNNRNCLLHSHKIPSFVTSSHYEVSCYANLDQSDNKDDWVIEIQEHGKSPSPIFANEAEDEIHPISTNFRLRHKVLGCYLATTGKSYPAWGFQQGEVICKKTYLANDKSTWWNVEDHENEYLPPLQQKYVPPKPKFWREFILVNYGMMASNNALVPDGNKFDRLSSKWWEWPILRIGLRMNSWSATSVKFFLMGNPFVTWFSTFNIAVITLYFMVQLWRWQRQKLNFNGIFDSHFNKLIIQAFLPFMGWVFHYVPFIMMGRVTYLHHYVPAQYFAIFISGFIMETFIYKKCNKYVTWTLFGISYLLTIGCFWYFRYFSWGMEGSPKNFNHLKLLSSWMVS
ncbi:dolichyl-phosphate-mannose--protein mannosyltransferase 6 [[Candida] jaroonii]|uniref:Dolichyl-phosphate-mannose--protein mannosyltransferase 6 n=1 Tax=[Candida] jaroonii TaxID=467808 RepID=A0ACA9Y264_9ASCO|nr:dolichyl-phosphate-mannose--protein mannosyltransferase 6 [[Candida] jaroonii]